jgi:hypothetical protein
MIHEKNAVCSVALDRIHDIHDPVDGVALEEVSTSADAADSRS